MKRKIMRSPKMRTGELSAKWTNVPKIEFSPALYIDILCIVYITGIFRQQ